MTTAPQLYLRLQSCLQTILELESELKELPVAQPLLTEFTTLKEIYCRLEKICLQENDVQRIEDATAHLLEELDKSMQSKPLARSGQKYLQ